MLTVTRPIKRIAQNAMKIKEIKYNKINTQNHSLKLTSSIKMQRSYFLDASSVFLLFSMCFCLLFVYFFLCSVL